jgi:hypothetical protein
MPSVSKKQARFMAMLANDPKKAKAAGVPLKVAREFNEADKKAGTLKKDKRK